MMKKMIMISRTSGSSTDILRSMKSGTYRSAATKTHRSAYS